MHIRLSNRRRLLLLGYLLLGPILGILFIPGEDIFSKAAPGFLLSIFSCILIFPELRAAVFSGNNPFGFNMRQYFSHPTQWPMMIGLLWFLFGFLILGITSTLFPFFIPEESRINVLFIGVLIPAHSLIGLSGYRIIKRRETVNELGQIYRGNWAYITGIVTIFYGWGGILLMAIAFLIT